MLEMRMMFISIKWSKAGIRKRVIGRVWPTSELGAPRLLNILHGGGEQTLDSRRDLNLTSCCSRSERINDGLQMVNHIGGIAQYTSHSQRGNVAEIVLLQAVQEVNNEHDAN